MLRGVSCGHYLLLDEGSKSRGLLIVAAITFEQFASFTNTCPYGHVFGEANWFEQLSQSPKDCIRSRWMTASKGCIAGWSLCTSVQQGHWLGLFKLPLPLLYYYIITAFYRFDTFLHFPILDIFYKFVHLVHLTHFVNLAHWTLLTRWSIGHSLPLVHLSPVHFWHLGKYFPFSLFFAFYSFFYYYIMGQISYWRRKIK